MKPLDPRLLSTAKSIRLFIGGVAILAVANMALTTLFAWHLSAFIVAIFLQQKQISEATPHLLWFATAGVTRACTLWLQEWLSAIAATRAKNELRGKLLNAIGRLGPTWLSNYGTSRMQTLATQQLDALDTYFGKFLPQLVFALIITPVYTVVIFNQDAASGWALICTIPLIPLFMILIGWATQRIQDSQLKSLQILTTHFSQALRGLTTLKVFGRAENQVKVIRSTSESYRRRTLKVLRLSFLSGFALELISSLSVALIAVSIGLRLVNGQISLAVGLFILLLAPEVYLPLRLVGANFHASYEGVAASGAVLEVIETIPPDSNDPFPKINYLDGHLTVIHGPSGSGKTTRLNSLRMRLGSREVAWLPQDIRLLEGSVRENIVGPALEVDDSKLAEAVRLAALDDLELDYIVGEGALRVSGGQSQRIGLARAFYAALADDRRILLLDEPISAQDPTRAQQIASSLSALANRGFTVVAVSHHTIAGASKVIEVERA